MARQRHISKPSFLLRLGASAGLAIALWLGVIAGPSAGLTCAESGETPGVVEDVLSGRHALADRWDVIVAGTVSEVRPLGDGYDANGAEVVLAVDAWFRGGEGLQQNLEVFDPPRGASGVGFRVGQDYLVFASTDFGWDGKLATGLCELTFEIDPIRLQELVAAFGPSLPDTVTATSASYVTEVGAALVAVGIILLLGTYRRFVDDGSADAAPLRSNDSGLRIE